MSAIALLWLVALLELTFGGLLDRMVLVPTTEPLPTTGLTRVMVARPGGEVEVFLRRPHAAKGKPPQAYVLQFCGQGARAERWHWHPLDQVPGLDLEYWTVNSPGSGRSTGPARLAEIAPAADAVYAKLAAVAAEHPILLAGGSLGSVPALYVAAHHSVAGVFLHNPPPLPQMIRDLYGWWNLWTLSVPASCWIPKELDSVANARRCREPAVIEMAGADRTVPVAYQKRIAAAYAGPKKLLLEPGAWHEGGETAAQLRDLALALDWLARCASRPPAAAAPGAGRRYRSSITGAARKRPSSPSWLISKTCQVSPRR